MNPIFEDVFPRNYECKVCESAPTSTGNAYAYPGGVAGKWAQGVIVEIAPHSISEIWVGSFANGDLSPNAISRVFSHPSPSHILAIARGDGYVVNVNDPADFFCISQISPIMGAAAIPELNLIVIHDFSRIAAIGADGVAWRTPSLSWDGLAIERIVDGVLYARGWDSPNNCSTSIVVHLLTGQISGGASPELLGIHE